MSITFLIPTELNLVQSTLDNCGVKYKKLVGLTKNLIKSLPNGSILYWDLQGWSDFIDSHEIFDDFFNRNCKLIIQEKENHKLWIETKKDIGPHPNKTWNKIFNNLKYYQKYKDSIYILYYGKTTLDIGFKTISLSPIENPEHYLHYKYLDRNQPTDIDFSLLSNIKPMRPWRQHVFDQVNKNTVLNNCKNIISNRVEIDYYKRYQDFDGYKKVNFSVVLETNVKNEFTLISEKTLKPIMCKIPFLVLADNNYYQTLKSLGFWTFENLINESWSSNNILESRVKGLIDTMSNIIVRSSKKFFNESRKICEYNFNHLGYILGQEYRNQQKIIFNFHQSLLDSSLSETA